MEMKLDFLSTLSLNDISVSVGDADRDDDAEEDSKGGDDEGGTTETLSQLRKRSRKRRSFVETDYTSRVSYPVPETRQGLVISRFHNSILKDTCDAQMLSSDPEPSEQTKNPSPTVSSLTHSEGEPAQLESKPILSKSNLHGPCPPSDLGSHEQSRDGQPASRNRRPEMEMEPDAMESKSVTDAVKAVSPTITVVRCRVDPDGKECSDRRGDGKEELEGQEKSDDEKQEEDTTALSKTGLFASHILLPEISEEKEKGETDEKDGLRGSSCGTKRPLLGAERQPEANTLPTCLKDVSIKGSNGLPGAHLIAPEHVEGHMLKRSNPLSYSPPPPPPSSPLPPTPVTQTSQSECEEGERRGDLKENKGTSNQIPASDSNENPSCQHNHSGKAHLQFEAAKGENEDEAVSVVSDEVTDSTNSDNVFEDDETSFSLNSNSSEKKYDWSLTTRRSISANLATLGKGDSQVKHHASTEAHRRIHSLNNDYTFAIKSITAKLGAATSVTSPTFNSGTKFADEVTRESTLSSNQTADKPRSDSAVTSAEACNSAAHIFTNANADNIHNLSKCPPSPTHFLFQTCSPSIMGRLSASTLRGKIQKLPLYLSRSQESLNHAGEGSVAESPDQNHGKENVEITITDVNDVTQAVGFETDTTAESVESDDSDTTVTGSEVDGEFYVEADPAKSFYSSSEVNEASCSALPVQSEPKAQHQDKLLDTGLSKNTPGPITEPPVSILNSLQGDTPGPKMDAAGPMKESSPLIPSGIVVTTQNLNGPGLPFLSQSQTVRRTSRDRPLIGLCGSTEHRIDSPNKQSPGCRVFTICEDLPQTTTAEVLPAPPLKSELGCSSVLESGCESVMEGMQVPLDACGCPAVYTNCFGGGDSFDEELTVYEFSCRTQNSSVTQTSGAVPLMTSPPVSSFLSISSSHSPFFSPSNLFSSSASELSPLLSPLSETSHCFPSQTHKDIVSQLGQQCYPEPPTGFQVLRVDVDQLLSVLESSSTDRSATGLGGRHPRDTCPAHFTENKRVLQIEAKRLMSNCQKVVGTGQSPEEMLHSLAESFRTLVELAVICLWFSGCDRCDRRNAEAVAGLADVARSFRDFCLAAERVSSKRSCQDLSTKLLAKQCTALTASVFCLTQIFRTLTAL